jgi:hypothetical protein
MAEKMMYLRVDQQQILDAFSLDVLCPLLLSERIFYKGQIDNFLKTKS